MTDRAAVDRIAGRATRQLSALWVQYVTGKISADQLDAIGSAIVAGSNTVSARQAYSDMLRWAAINGRALGTADMAASLIHARNPSRIGKALATIRNEADLTDVESVTAGALRIARLARAEPHNTAQEVTGELVKNTANGWIRALNPGACELCRYWSRDGRVWPAAHSMPTHKGCTCYQSPTTQKARPLNAR